MWDYIKETPWKVMLGISAVVATGGLAAAAAAGVAAYAGSKRSEQTRQTCVR